MHVVRADRFAGLGQTVPYESLSLQGKLNFLNRQLSAIAASIGTVRAYPESAEKQFSLEQLRQAYKRLSQRAAALRVEASQREAPSSFMLALDRFSDSALVVGKDVMGVAGAAAKGLTGILKGLPLYLLLALVVAGLGGYGYVKHGLPGGRK